MKKKLLAALVCVAIVLSMCSIMAFAATTTTIIKEITCVDEISLDVGATEVTKAIDYILIEDAKQKVDTDPETTLHVAKADVGNYLKAEAGKIYKTSGGEAVKITVFPKDKVTIDGAKTEFEVKIKRVEKLYTLTTGVRKYNANGKALMASEIAKVTTTVTYIKDGKQVKSVSDNIYDLNYDDTLELKADLKDKYKDFYVFSCWIDGDGTVIEKTKNPYTCTVGGNITLYAVFKEAKDRYIIDVSTSDGGAVIFNDELKVIGEASESVSNDKVAGKPTEKTIDNGLLGVENTNKESVTGGTSALVSVMEDTTPTFTFVPDSGYEVSKVTVDGEQINSYRWVARNLAEMFNKSDFQGALKILGTYNDATNKDVYTYTFKPIEDDTSISVQFSKKTKIEPGTGVEYVPGPELSTGADATDKADATDANGEPAAANPAATTLPAENAVDYFSSDVANPQTGSASTTAAIAAFATISFAAAAAFVSYKKKH